MIPIVDGHHHIWRQADLPWLVGPMQPRIFGPYEPIRRDYSIDEYRADIAGSDVVKSVYVQTNWPRERFEDEAAWVQKTAQATGWPHAIVAYADFSEPDVRPQLDRLARYDLVRGAAHAIALAREPALSFRRARGSRRRSGPPPQHPPSRRVRLELRSPGLCQTDGRRSRSRRGLPERDLRAAARRHARGSLARGPRGMARRHGAPRGMSKRCFQALGARHFPAPERSRPYRRDSCARRWKSSAQGAACSGRISRSRSSGPRTARSSTPIAMRRSSLPEADQRALLHDTAMRVYRIPP